MPVEETFNRPWVLLCEGDGDLKFYRLLLKEHGLDEKFQIVKPEYKAMHDGGRGSFGHYLKYIQVNKSWRREVQAVLIVSDNDIDPAASFSEVQADLKTVTGYGVPDAPGVVAKSKYGLPSVVVLMVPIDEPGSLETLCLTPAYEKWPDLVQPLDAYVAQSPASGFTMVKQAKMRLQTILASTNDKRPEYGFAAHWGCKDKYRIPIVHASFDPIVAFLKGFEDTLSAT